MMEPLQKATCVRLESVPPAQFSRERVVNGIKSYDTRNMTTPPSLFPPNFVPTRRWYFARPPESQG